MSDQIAVNYAVLEKALGDLQKILHDYEKLLTNLDGDLKAHLTEWSGEAKDAYHLWHTQWTLGARYLQAWLESLGDHVHHSHKTLKAADDLVASYWS